MADDAERRLLEEQLELQLQEQKESIAALDEALASDPQNPEILEVHAELLQAIKDAEEGLFLLKRARLLQEVNLLQNSKDGGNGVNQDPIDSKDVNVEPLKEAKNVNHDLFYSKETEVEPLKEYYVGSKCRFRHSDGRWYNGLIVAKEASIGAKVSFLTPTSENQLMCKFFLQQRCRFGTNCRSSHGIDLPLSSLKKYNPTTWNQSLVGSTVWATSDSRTGIWREAELESWDDDHGSGRVVFRDDGSSSNVGNESISLSEYAQMSDDEDDSDSYSDSDQYDPTDCEIEDAPEGLGFLGSPNLQRGIQTETAIFAKWENHTRGIASKMMANMGFKEGMGLGAKGQGRLDPILVKVLPPKQSLDHALESVENKDQQEKKRSRGGKRKRDKKFAAAARAAKQKEEPDSDIFSLINTQLAMHDEALKVGSVKKQQKKDLQVGKNSDRRALVAFDDEVKELRARVQKLEEMATRNKKEKVVYEAALRKLNETRKTLAEVEAAHASASNAVANKEKEKRWLKF